MSGKSSAADTPTTEVKLLKDGNWALIQQNTFTRWVNQHLKNAEGSPQIDNLATAFHDGILLIRLAEVLSHRTFSRFNRKPIMRTQKLDNISTVLNFLQTEENIKIVNIDSSHIADHNLKLILGLIWTLIQHYSISQPIPTTEPTGSEQSGTAKGDEQSRKKPEQSPKQRLLAWVQAKVGHGQPVHNFTSDWNNGILLGALVDSCLGTGSFVEWHRWNAKDAVENTHRAMQAAEDGLGVEKLITPEELTNPKVDEKSVMTYLAQFPRAQPQLLGVVSGLDHRPLLGVPSNFRVQLQRANLRPSIDVLESHGDPLDELRMSQLEGEQSDNICPVYDVVFVPKRIGEHTVNVYAQNVIDLMGPRLPIEKITVNVMPAPKVLGLRTEAVQGEHQRFQIANVDDYQQLDVMAVDPDGREIVLDAGSERDQHSQVTCCYTPSTPGQHSIFVMYGKRHIPHSPFPLHVRPNPITDIPPLLTPMATPEQLNSHGDRSSSLATQLWLYGPGISPSVPVNRSTDFIVHKRNEVPTEEDEYIVAVPHIQLFAPDWKELNTETQLLQSDHSEIVYKISYKPEIVGEYRIKVLCNEVPIFSEVPVIAVDEQILFDYPSSNNKLELRKLHYTPELGNGIAVVERKNSPILSQIHLGHRISLLFSSPDIDSKQELRARLEQPGGVVLGRDGTVDIERIGQNQFRLSFVPLVDGSHFVEVFQGRQPIEGSPFEVKVGKAHLVFAQGPGLKEAFVGQENSFTVQSSTSTDNFVLKMDGPGETKMNMMDDPGEDGIAHVKYRVDKPGKYRISMLIEGTHISGSPFQVEVKPPAEGKEPKELKVVKRVIKTQTIIGQVETEQQNKQIDLDLLQRQLASDASPIHFTHRQLELEHQPMEIVANYVLEGSLLTANHIKNELLDPRDITVISDVRMVELKGGGLKEFVPGQPAKFTVNTSRTGLDTLFVAVVTSHGPAEEVNVRHIGNGKYKVSYTSLHASNVLVFVKYGQQDVDGSPFSVLPSLHSNGGMLCSADHRHKRE